LHYVSTRGETAHLGFEDVLLAGLARDGGLYVPESWPHFAPDQIRALAGLDYAELAARIIAPFVGDAVDDAELRRICRDAYARFNHPAVAPLVEIDRNLWLLELFHGPTLAFKDFALQVLGRLFDHALKKRGQRVTVIGATSGDTGSAAIEACRDRDAVDIFILHPKGRVSDVQRRQMTTVPSLNVHNLAIEGTFDDCQDLVKGMFNDRPFRDTFRLSSVNSINWARIVAQAAYYFAAATALGAPDRRIAFCVPTGNFGNVYAGYVAHRMGLPVQGFIVASNRNDILTRFFEFGRMDIRPVAPSWSPSMDIQVSSNFERLLFEMLDRDAAAVARLMTEFRTTGTMTAAPAGLGNLFAAARCSDDQTLAVIADVHKRSGMLVDPHTAVGIAAARQLRGDPSVPLVVMATAHPAKFPEAVAKATGVAPTLPPALADLMDRPERCTVLPNNLRAVEDFVRTRNSLRGAA
jgi:threonine synthase